MVYHHRGTFLEAAGNIMSWPLPAKPVYLWTLPMFHCNGWCFPWSVTAMGGTHVCLRKVDPALIFPMIVEHGVTHMCGAPTVLGMLTSAPAEQRRRFNHIVDIQTGGSPPPAKIIKAMEELGFRVTHIYGMTELQGPSTLCVPQDDWATLPLEERAALTARQGVRYAVVEGQMVADPRSMKPVPRDGKTMGEIMIRGNTVMLGYLKEPKATADAFRGGWMHTGDLAVEHPDGYIEIKDRAKDIIISGGENISSVEVEIALYKHPAGAACRRGRKAGRQMGRDARAPSCSSSRARMRAPKRSSPSAAISSRISRRRRPWCSVRCRRPRPARSRNSRCASGRARLQSRSTHQQLRQEQRQDREAHQENDAARRRPSGTARHPAPRSRTSCDRRPRR